MRKQTDLAAMKQLARVFLMMDPEPTSFSPVIIKHPFTDSGIVTVRSGNEYRAADITADEAVRSQWREQMASLIENAETPRHIYMMLTKSYLSHNGALLLDCYNTPEKVDALLALGELSHLGKDMEAAPHEIADLKGMEGVTVAYCRDRGEAYRKPESYTLEELCSETPSVYQYVFTLEHAWKYHYGSKGTALSDVQKDLDAQYAYYGLERPESYYGRLNEGIAREMTEGQAESQGPALTM